MKNKKQKWFYVNFYKNDNKHLFYRLNPYWCGITFNTLKEIIKKEAPSDSRYCYTIKFNNKEASIIDLRKLEKAKTQKVQAKPVKVKSSVKVKKIIVSPVSKLFKTTSYKSRLSPKLASLAVKSMIPRKPPVVKVSKAKANKPVKKVVKIKSKK